MKYTKSERNNLTFRNVFSTYFANVDIGYDDCFSYVNDKGKVIRSVNYKRKMRDEWKITWKEENGNWMGDDS